MSLTPNAIRDGDPYALALLVERRGGPVLAYADELTPPDRALVATAEAFAQFRTAVASAPDPNALDPETALLEATRAAVARHAENPYRPAGRERPARRTRTCELMPRLLVAWTEGRLSIEDEHRLVRHLRQCPDCRALNDAFARAEERYRNGPPAAMDAAEVAMVVSSTVAAAPTPPPTNREPEPEPAAAPPPPVAEDPLLASAHAEAHDAPEVREEPEPEPEQPVGFADEPAPVADPAEAVAAEQPPAEPEPEVPVSPAPVDEVPDASDVPDAPVVAPDPVPSVDDVVPVGPVDDGADEAPAPAPGPGPGPAAIIEPDEAAPAPAPSEPAPPAPRGRGGGIGASALRRVVGVPGSLGRLVGGGGSAEPAGTPEPPPAVRSHDPDAALPTRRPAPSDAPLLHGTVEDDRGRTRIDDDVPADDAPAATGVTDPEPPSTPDAEPRGSWSTVVLAPDDPVGPEALGYVVPQPGLPRPSRTPPRRRRRSATEVVAPDPPVAPDPEPAPAASGPPVGDDVVDGPSPEAVLEAPALEPVADPPSSEPVDAPALAVDAPAADRDPAGDDDEFEDEVPPADVTAVHAVPVLPDATEHETPEQAAPQRTRPVPLEEPQAYVVPDPDPESQAVVADAPRPVPPATVDGASPRVRTPSGAATIVRQLGIPAVLLIVVLVVALAAAGAFSTHEDDSAPSTPTTPSGVPASPQQVPSLPIPR